MSRMIPVVALLVLSFLLPAVAEDDPTEWTKIWSAPGTFGALAFSPDGATLYASKGRQLLQWRTDSGALGTPLPGGRVDDLAVAPDGTIAALANDEVLVWERGDTSQEPRRSHHEGAFSHIAIGPGASRMAIRSSSGEDELIHILDVPGGDVRHVLAGHTAGINELAFSPDGRTLASAAQDSTIRLWSVESGQQLRTIRGGDGRIFSGLAYLSGGRQLVTSDFSRELVFWDASGGWDGAGALLRKVSARQKAQCLAAREDVIATGHWGGAVRLWSPDGELLQAIEVPSLASDVALSPDGRWLAFCEGLPKGSLQVWYRGEPPAPSDAEGPLVLPTGAWAAAWSPDGTALFTAGSSDGVSRWTLDRPVQGRPISDAPLAVTYWLKCAGESLVYDLRTNPLGGGCEIVVADSSTGAEKRRIPLAQPEDIPLTSLALDPLGRTLVIHRHLGDRSVLEAYDLSSGKRLFQGDAGDQRLRSSLAFHPTGKVVALGTRELIQLWSIAQGKKLGSIGGNDAAAELTTVFTADGRGLITIGRRGEGRLTVWSLAQERAIRKLELGARLHSATVGPHMKLAAALDKEGRVKLVDLKSWRVLDRSIRTAPPFTFYPVGLAFDPSGERLLVGGGERSEVTQVHSVP